MRLRNIVTGVVVNVRDDHPIVSDSQWGDVDAKQAVERSDAPDKSWKVADLKAHAEENGIDLGDATKKDDILAVIVAAGASGSEDEEESREEESEED